MLSTPRGWQSDLLLQILGCCVGVWFALGARAVAQPVGAKVCGRCHPREFDAWRSGPHARAHEALAPHQKRDPHCRTCHDEAGLSGLLRRSFDLKHTRPLNERGVDCESCHGLGGELLNKDLQHRVWTPERTTKKKGGKSGHKRSPRVLSAARVDSGAPSVIKTPRITSKTCDRCHRLDPIVSPPSLYPPFSPQRPFIHGQYR